jgi:hypothetical protein
MRRFAACFACAVAAGAAAVTAPPAVASTARVTTMVVGKDRVLRDATAVRLKQRTVRVGRRRCAVGAATPLGALAGLGLALRVRDYGSCGRRPADAGGLFVTSVAGERNRGRNGWVYKLGRRAGSSGAADPAGPFGTGRRLRAGDRLLWFWCRMQPSGGCQRTLEAVPDRRRTAPGDVLRVTVRAYDDQGRGRPAPAATVRLGSVSAVTGPDGVAVVPVAESGRLRLDATAPGLVPSFPTRVVSG